MSLDSNDITYLQFTSGGEVAGTHLVNIAKKYDACVCEFNQQKEKRKKKLVPIFFLISY